MKFIFSLNVCANIIKNGKRKTENGKLFSFFLYYLAYSPHHISPSPLGYRKRYPTVKGNNPTKDAPPLIGIDNDTQHTRRTHANKHRYRKRYPALESYYPAPLWVQKKSYQMPGNSFPLTLRYRKRYPALERVLPSLQRHASPPSRVLPGTRGGNARKQIWGIENDTRQ